MPWLSHSQPIRKDGKGDSLDAGGSEVVLVEVIPGVVVVHRMEIGMVTMKAMIRGMMITMVVVVDMVGVMVIEIVMEVVMVMATMMITVAAMAMATGMGKLLEVVEVDLHALPGVVHPVEVQCVVVGFQEEVDVEDPGVDQHGVEGVDQADVVDQEEVVLLLVRGSMVQIHCKHQWSILIPSAGTWDRAKEEVGEASQLRSNRCMIVATETSRTKNGTVTAMVDSGSEKRNLFAANFYLAAHST